MRLVTAERLATTGGGWRAIGLFVLPLAMFGCSKSIEKPGSEHQTAIKALEGYGPLKFGMSFEEAVGELPDASWNPSSVERCRTEMPLKGCLLSQYGDNSAIRRLDGIPFQPQLSFDQHAALTEIGLVYEDEHGLTASQCLTLFGRMVDALAKEYGPFASSRPPDGETSKIVSAKTPGGIAYFHSVPDPSTLTLPMRSHVEGVKFPTKAPITRWNDKAYISTFAFYIVTAKPTCRISATFQKPHISQHEESLEDLAKETP